MGQTDIVTASVFIGPPPLPWSHGALLQGRENKPVLYYKIKKNEHYLKDLLAQIMTKVHLLDSRN